MSRAAYEVQRAAWVKRRVHIAASFVRIEFTTTERADQLHHNNAPAHSTTLVQAFLAKYHNIPVCQPPYSPDLAPCDFWLFPKLKSPFKIGHLWLWRSHSTQRRLTADWLALTEEGLFTDAQ